VSLLYLAGIKASAVQVRADAKHYLDLDMLVTKGGISLPSALAAARCVDLDRLPTLNELIRGKGEGLDLGL
jgi:predicted flavoprotein YhiN